MSTAKKAAKPTRKDLAGRMCALAAELHALETDDTRLAGDLLKAVSFQVEHFEGSEMHNRRRYWTEGYVAALAAIAPQWHPEAKWWLAAPERAELAAAKALRLSHLHGGVSR